MDDDPYLAAQLSAWLSDIGYVYTATTSAHALALGAVVPPDVAVVDIVLPRMDGFELVQALRRQPGLSQLPVLFVTGSDRLDIPARAEDMGACSVAYKPLDEEALAEAVVALLRRRSAPA